MATSIPIHTSLLGSRGPAGVAPSSSNPLPALLQTPSGLAVLEMQGTINFGGGSSNDDDDDGTETEETMAGAIPTGRLVFPDFDPAKPSDDTAWMKRVWLYVGSHQRMTGEVKKVPKPFAVVRRRRRAETQAEDETPGSSAGDDELRDGLEVVEIIRWKLSFAIRPEPVGTQEQAVYNEEEQKSLR